VSCTWRITWHLRRKDPDALAQIVVSLDQACLGVRDFVFATGAALRISLAA
jgi:hypothetical protein